MCSILENEDDLQLPDHFGTDVIPTESDCVKDLQRSNHLIRTEKNVRNPGCSQDHFRAGSQGAASRCTHRSVQPKMLISWYVQCCTNPDRVYTKLLQNISSSHFCRRGDSLAVLANQIFKGDKEFRCRIDNRREWSFFTHRGLQLAPSQAQTHTGNTPCVTKDSSQS